MEVNRDAAYVEIIHLSDLHFGPGHVFTPEPTPDDRTAATAGTYTLAEKVIEDLKNEKTNPFPRPRSPETPAAGPPDPGGPQFVYPEFPRILCLSGDFTQAGLEEEFVQAETLVLKFREDTSLRIQPDGVFTCPGNHDLAWTKSTTKERWQEYATFLGYISGAHHDARNAALFGGVQVCHGARTLVLSLNSEMEVKNQKGDQARGDLSAAQLSFARDQIERLSPEIRRDYIKVAMVHHHPVLLPWSAEAGRGYDAITGASQLLAMLHEHQFHVVLHGHKHYPHTFREDVRSAFKQVPDHSLFIVAGGTCGSSEFLAPRPKYATQTYNRVRVHWSSKDGTTRVQVATRGLVRFKDSGDDLLPDKWHWTTLAIDDRHLISHRRPDVARASSMRYQAPMTQGSPAEAARIEEYARTHGYFPVAEVFPAMMPGQRAEVHLRIADHGSRNPRPLLSTVTWAAGPKFPTVVVSGEEDPDFRATFAYYGGALFQAQMTFTDNSTACAHVYVPLPTSQAAPTAANRG